MSYMKAAMTGGSYIFGTKSMATVSALTTVACGADLVYDWIGGQDKGGLADFFYRAATGSSTQEQLSTNSMSAKRGRILGTLGGMIFDVWVPLVGAKVPMLRMPLMGWQGYQAYREFGHGDFDGPFDMINGINNLSNVALMASGGKLLPLMYRRSLLSSKLSTTLSPSLCRNLLASTDSKIAGLVTKSFGFLKPIAQGFRSLFV